MTDIAFDQIITGERIQLRCDWMIGTTMDFDANPLIKDNFSARKINLDNFDRTREIVGTKIFIYSHRLSEIQTLKFQDPFDLYVHNSDHNLDHQFLWLRDMPMIRRVYAQNLLVQCDDFFHLLPIGIANSMWNHGDLSLLKMVMEDHLPPTRGIYFNFSVQTNPSQRQPCFQAGLALGLTFQPPDLDQQSYLQNLASHQYCLCPTGNGADTHRLWECLYLGVIPICQESLFVRNLVESGYSIVVVNQWDDLDPVQLLPPLTPSKLDHLRLDFFIARDELFSGQNDHDNYTDNDKRY